MDSEPVYLKRLQRHMAHHGEDYTTERLRQYVGKPSLSIARTLIEIHNLSMTPEEFLAEEVDLYGHFYLDSTELALFVGAAEFLNLIRARGMKTALVTSTSSKSVLAALARFQVVPCFDAIVCRDMVRNPKPSPEPYQMAAGFLQAEAGDCIVVEDSPVGIAAGKAAGMTVVAMKASEIRQDTGSADIEAEDYHQLRVL
ncbi:MAG: HAD family phosphatase, partial [Pseudoflavonifractor sp.]|nr:HAD family phosphatase [Pseudoflavonifractor sp.]